MAAERIAYRNYRCRECGTERQLQTNHRMDCYPTCTKCKQWVRVGRGAGEQEIGVARQTTHEYIGEITQEESL